MGYNSTYIELCASVVLALGRAAYNDQVGLMPLYAIPPDPEPTEVELAPYCSAVRRDMGLSVAERDVRLFALMKWQEDQRVLNDSAFIVHFATEVDDDNRYKNKPIWTLIRARVLKAGNRKCACCPGKATQVHHRDYRLSVLRGEDDRPLVAMSKVCHDKVHTRPHNDVRGLREDVLALLKMNVLKRKSGDPSAPTRKVIFAIA